MAGSLSHIVGDDGAFRMSLIENLGDAHEALDECFKIIHYLTRGSKAEINHACRRFGFPEIDCDMKLGGDDAL